jgi:hypothetical protein
MLRPQPLIGGIDQVNARRSACSGWDRGPIGALERDENAASPRRSDMRRRPGDAAERARSRPRHAQWRRFPHDSGMSDADAQAN